MNVDLLECKRKAIEITSSENPPLGVNGKKKGYIEVLEELWNGKRYGHLNLKSQNLRDQASRLEKLPKYAEKSNESNSETTNVSQNANSPTFYPNLHTTPISFPGEQRASIEDQAIINQPIDRDDNVAGRLPEYKPADGLTTFEWGRNTNGGIIWMTTSTIANAYEEITRWRKNTFLVPYGKIGKEFIDQLTMHIMDWNNGSESQHIALKAAFVLVAVCLQKPSQKSKTKDHKECLTRRVALWKNGDIDQLIREGRMIQQRIGRSRKIEPPNKAKIFAKLVMEGQINAALRYLSDNDSKGVLPLSDDVMEQLQEKHPEPQEARLGSLLFGPRR